MGEAECLITFCVFFFCCFALQAGLNPVFFFFTFYAWSYNDAVHATISIFLCVTFEARRTATFGEEQKVKEVWTGLRIHFFFSFVSFLPLHPSHPSQTYFQHRLSPSTSDTKHLSAPSYPLLLLRPFGQIPLAFGIYPWLSRKIIADQTQTLEREKKNVRMSWKMSTSNNTEKHCRQDFPDVNPVFFIIANSQRTSLQAQKP